MTPANAVQKPLSITTGAVSNKVGTSVRPYDLSMIKKVKPDVVSKTINEEVSMRDFMLSQHE